MSDNEQDFAKPEDLLWDGRVLKTVKKIGRPGPRPEWGDQVTLKYWLREEGDVNPETMVERQTRILRMRRQWTYHVGDDDPSFLPRRLGEVVLMSMAVSEQARFSLSTECFTADEPWPEAPWLLAGTGGFERVDVDRVVYEIELLAFSKGEQPINIGEPLVHCGGPAVTKRRPLRETGVFVSFPDPVDLQREFQRSAKQTAKADIGDDEVLHGLLEQSAQQQEKARKKEERTLRDAAKMVHTDPDTSETLISDMDAQRGPASKTCRAEAVPGPHPGLQHEKARQLEAEEAAKAASRRSRMALSQAAGRSWHPWGDGAHPLSTWNKIQETKNAAAVTQAGVGLGDAIAATPSQEQAGHGVKEPPGSSGSPSQCVDQANHPTSHGDCGDRAHFDMCRSPRMSDSTEPHRPCADAHYCSNSLGDGFLDASVAASKPRVCPLEFDMVKVRIEAQDRWGALLFARQTLEYVHGIGEQADCIDVAIGCMAAGESCDIQCHSRAALVGGPPLLQDPWLPASFHVFLESFVPNAESGASLADLPLQQRMRWAGKLRLAAADLQRQGRHYLARRLYLRILAAIGPGVSPMGDVGRRRAVAELRRHCLVQSASCELKLELPSLARASANAVLNENGPSACALTLRGRALLTLDPCSAVTDFREVLRLDPASRRAERLLERAQQQVKRQRRAKKWFDGCGIEARMSEANDKHVCVQCSRYRPGGHSADDCSKWDGQYFCSECWECWVKIRRSQQRELDRRVDQAVHSEYSTHTDELPSLDDVPKEWDDLHPMWARAGEKQAWQLDHVGEKTRRQIIANNEERETRKHAARHAREEAEAILHAVADAQAAEREVWEQAELGLGNYRGAFEDAVSRAELLKALRAGGAAAEAAVAEVIGG